MKQKTKQKTSYPQILQHLELLIKQHSLESEETKENALDFKPLLNQLAHHTQQSHEQLLQQGFRKAYRQLIEGL